MGYIPDETVTEVLQKTDIVQVISEYIKLTKRGKNYFGHCPFHQEDTPSFSVTPDKQIFYCFGCNAGGNVFRFIMMHEGLSFPDAIRRVAEKAGVYIPLKTGDDESPEQQGKKRAYKINETALKYFHHCLFQPRGAMALEYLEKRGLSGEIIDNFKIGYAPEGWNNLINFFTSKGCGLDELENIGLTIKSQQGSNYYDRFRNRVILPIFDGAGKVVGFGGRALDDSKPKYLNTPETPYFNKRNLLYGLHLARNPIRDSGYVVVMEGYLDVITAHQFGIRNAVASLGTALTKEQVKMLMKYTSEVVIAYDTDDAGVNATIRGLDLIQQMGCRVKVVSIPQGKDPDEYLRTYGIEGWNKLIKSAYNLIEYKLYIAVANGIPTTVAEKISILQQVLPNMANIKNPVEREESIKSVAGVLNVSWEAISGELKRFILEQRKKPPITDNYANLKHNIKPMDKSVNANQRAEYLLTGLILSDLKYLSIVKEYLDLKDIQDAQLKIILELLLSKEDSIQNPENYKTEPAKMMQRLDESGQQLLSRLLMEEIPGNNPVDIIKDCINTIKNAAIKRHQQKIIEQIKIAEQTGDQQRAIKLLQELQQLHKT